MWFDKGLRKMEDFYKGRDLMSFAQIVAQFDIPKNISLNSFNLEAMFLLIKVQNLPNLIKHLLNTVIKSAQSKGLISMFYKMLESFSKNHQN